MCPSSAILGRGGFDLDRIVALEPEFLEPAHGEPGHVHDEHCEHDHDNHDTRRATTKSTTTTSRAFPCAWTARSTATR